jgi:hypothetical protein
MSIQLAHGSGRISCKEGTKLSERSGTLADDPFSGRHPTSHERPTGLPWDASYHDGPAPWDIGQPQPAIVRLASEGGFAGAVLDGLRDRRERSSRRLAGIVGSGR